MSKLTKLVTDPRGFVRDSRLYKRYFEGEEERKPVRPPAPRYDPAAAARPVAPPKPTPDQPREHPLPTLNLAEETKLSDAEVAAASASTRFLRYAVDDAVEQRVTERIAARVRRLMDEAGLPQRDWAADVRDFFQCYERNPAAGAARTTAEGSLLWLFVLARAIQPKVMVESGVFKGASLFTLRHAVPGATLYGYEPELTNLLVRDATIRLHAGDWSQSFPHPGGSDDFCYFDDHISNCLRVRQAYDLGFRHLVFDDSPDIGQLHRWRYPGVPTIQMVVNQTLRPGEAVEWVWKNRKLRYVHREEDTHGARELVEAMLELPSLDGLTGRATGVQTYVRLKRRAP